MSMSALPLFLVGYSFIEELQRWVDADSAQKRRWLLESFEKRAVGCQLTWRADGQVHAYRVVKPTAEEAVYCALLEVA